MSNSVFVPALLGSDGSTFKDNRVKSNKHRPIISVSKCRPITIVFRNIRYRPYIRIFAGVPRGGTIKRQRSCRSLSCLAYINVPLSTDWGIPVYDAIFYAIFYSDGTIPDLLIPEIFLATT